MRRMTRLRLRNKIIEALNRWQQLGCLVRPHASGMLASMRGKERYLNRLVTGVTRDGRAILLYPILSRQAKIPRNICSLMMQYEGRNAIVGTCENIGDSWDVIADDENQWKRKKKTFLYRHWHEQYQLKEKQDEE